MSTYPSHSVGEVPTLLKRTEVTIRGLSMNTMRTMKKSTSSIKTRISSRRNAFQLTALMKVCSSVNDFYILEHLLNQGSATRSELVEATGIKWTTAHDALERLFAKNVLEKEVIKAGRGRPKVFWKIKEHSS